MKREIYIIRQQKDEKKRQQIILRTSCEFKDTKDCGGGKSLEKLKDNGWNEENRLGQLEK